MKKAYIIHDIKTNEYLTEGGWDSLHDAKNILLSEDVMVYPSIEDAQSGLDDVLSAWDKKYEDPSTDEYEFLEIAARWHLKIA